jgi:hypothetical protein
MSDGSNLAVCWVVHRDTKERGKSEFSREKLPQWRVEKLYSSSRQISGTSLTFVYMD